MRNLAPTRHLRQCLPLDEGESVDDVGLVRPGDVTLPPRFVGPIFIELREYVAEELEHLKYL